MSNLSLIKKPIITEKSTSLNAAGKYAFQVSPLATKNEVKKAIKEIYKVDVVAVNMLNKKSKRKNFRGVFGSQGSYKKALVTIKSGQKIDFT